MFPVNIHTVHAQIVNELSGGGNQVFKAGLICRDFIEVFTVGSSANGEDKIESGIFVALQFPKRIDAARGTIDRYISVGMLVNKLCEEALVAGSHNTRQGLTMTEPSPSSLWKCQLKTSMH